MKLSAVELSSFVPGAINPVTTADGKPIPPDVAMQMKVQSTKVNTQGTYAQTIQLMNNIERLRTLLRVNNLTVSGSGGPAQGNQAIKLATQFDLVAYIYDKSITPPKPTPAPTPAPK